MKFKHPEYEQFFHDLLCDEGEDLSKYASLFDFREPSVKRHELTGRKYSEAWQELEKRHGRICQLQYVDDCEIDNPAAIDHIIPVSSNVLNKQLLRSKPPAAGKKVLAESFGSNDISNLALACTRCNSNKKHRFLDRGRMKRILKSKGF